jgi:hypothetical protein
MNQNGGSHVNDEWLRGVFQHRCQAVGACRPSASRRLLQRGDRRLQRRDGRGAVTRFQRQVIKIRLPVDSRPLRGVRP